MSQETTSPQYDWQYKERVASDNELAGLTEKGIRPLIAELLVQRGIEREDRLRKFFRPSWADLHDPFSLKDMDKAVNRLVQAQHNREKVMVYGDYDVDGTTAVSMTYSFLQALAFDVHFYIPDRYEEGYGISFEGVEHAESLGCSLMIALDCGTTDLESIEQAQRLGIDVIICDHHEPGSELPPAFAMLNPKRQDCNYPFDGLSGCGVGFKLLHAFTLQNDIDERLIRSCLDFLALSIAADIVPMTDENRVLAHFGLESINSNMRPAFAEIFRCAKLRKPNYDISDLVFTIAPRINAAGRMEHASLAVELLCTRDSIDREELAKEIESLNEQRRADDRSITEQALKMLDEADDSDNPATVVYQPHWNKGVIGIVASRLIEKYYRPTIVLTGDNGTLTGSARSIEGFDIHQGLQSCSEVLDKFGGHAMAAGLTLQEKKLGDFRQQFSSNVASNLSRDGKAPLLIDRVIEISDFTVADYAQLKKMAPFGPGNLNPVFVARNVSLASPPKIIGSDKSHLQLNIKNGDSKGIKCMAFKLAHQRKAIQQSGKLDIAFSIHENFWNGKTSLQFHLKDWRPAEESA